MPEQQKQIAIYPARVIARATPQEELLRLITDIELEDVEPFFWPAEISSTRLDAYYTHMTETTLRNFAQDARAGVSFLDSHDSYKLGFGQSINGIFEVSEGVSRVVADFYTIPGIRFGGIHSYQSTDDFIRAVKTRLVRDVSVGFYGGEHICDICGGNYFNYSECPHFPGIEYPIGEQGNDTVMCTVAIDDAHLAEVSAVYDGATPEAMILKARSMAEEGQLESRVAEVLQVRYRIHLPDAYRNWQGAELKTRQTKPGDQTRSSENPSNENPSNGGNTMPDEVKVVEEVERTRELMAEAAVENADRLEDGVRWLISDRQRLAQENQDLQTRVNELAPLADDGRAYRQDLVAEALAEGVRALGEQFPQETYEQMLRDAPLDHIKKVRDTFKEQAAKRFPGHRQTTDEDETEDDATNERSSQEPGTPDIAYQI